MRLENGGEYREPFGTYCKAQGIKFEKAVPKTPLLYEVAERTNRTINERIRCMLSHAKLPRTFWVEAMFTTVHIINISPSVQLEDDIPQRV